VAKIVQIASNGGDNKYRVYGLDEAGVLYILYNKQWQKIVESPERKAKGNDSST